MKESLETLSPQEMRDSLDKRFMYLVLSQQEDKPAAAKTPKTPKTLKSSMQQLHDSCGAGEECEECEECEVSSKKPPKSIAAAQGRSFHVCFCRTTKQSKE